ncbi:P-loop containing nucleoside triphosphate hydrolase superfamily protein [Abeliophyllum distichum]|uniref:P-loop containing nucleoside triphosphate hydrolase superfamily protein n=1 Tax=Abeliophyllum distichum TaxID=126358 RepID=A0ABD1VPB7_9LAMI
MVLSGQLCSSNKPNGPPSYGIEDDDEEPLFGLDIEDNDVSCWKEFSLQNRMTSQVHGVWMCIPMLWFDVLVEIDPSALPVSFSKAVFWALSRFSMVEPENTEEMALPVRNWLATCASEISSLFSWKVPSGADDGGDGTESRNSVKASSMCLPLVRAFKRLTAHYTVKMEQDELRKQWTWEPMMSDSFVLLLVDPNDNTRRVTKLILEQVSGTHGLTRGLQFLCSSRSSLSAIFMGVRHALRLVQLDSVLLNFQTLHHFFFVLCKLLKEGNPCTETGSQKLSEASGGAKFSSQGGFLKQPVFDSSPTKVPGHSSTVSSTSWEKFSCLLSEIAWPSIQNCLAKGKTFIDYKVSQMTCIRLLEITPLVFERLSRNSGIMLENVDTIKWLQDLTDWGKSSSDAVVRYWKGTLASLLGLLKASCSNKAASAISNIEKLISSENLLTDEVNKQIATLSCLLLDKGSASKKTSIKSKSSPFHKLLHWRTCSAEDSENLLSDERKMHIVHNEPLIKMEKGDLIVLSDDEEEPDITGNKGVCSLVRSSQSMFGDKSVGASSAGRVLNADLHEMHSTTSGLMSQPEACYQLGSPDCNDLVSHKTGTDAMEDKQIPVSPIKTKQSDSKRKQVNGVNDSFPLQNNSNTKNITDETINSKRLDSSISQQYPNNKAWSDRSMTSKNKDQQGMNKVAKASDVVIKQVLWDTEEDPWEFSLFKPLRSQQTLVTKPITSGPKRQVIQLNLPVKNRSGSLRPDGGVRRFKPPRLDDWYRPILELDFFVAVGLESGNDEADQNASKLKEVPVSFQSPDEYLEVFRPLVLEEFKAQLRSSFQEMPSVEGMSCGSLSVLSVERIDDFHFVRVVYDENKSDISKFCSENDLILLTRQPLKNSFHDVHIVGKVERREKDNKRRLNILVIRVYLQGCSRLNRARKLLTDRSKWFVCRVMSITPQLREFQALSSIREIPLLPIVLNPVNYFSGRHEYRNENITRLSQPLQQVLKSSYNDSQLQAISASIGPFDLKKDFELSLIQGPPGTGKTRTIVAIASGLLAFSQMKDNKRLPSDSSKCSNVSSTKQRMSQSAAIARAWQDAALARQLNDDVEKNNKSTGSYTRGRILICAQSNAAVDELVARISSEGLYGHDGLMFKPYLVRVGNEKTVHPNSLPLFIDTLVDNRLAEERRNLNDEKNDTVGDPLTVLRSKLEKLVDRIRYYEAKRANVQEGNSNSSNMLEGDSVRGEDVKELSDAELGAMLRTLYDKKKIIYADLAAAQAKEKRTFEEIKALKHKFRKTILKEAEIVVTTLSGCGGDLYGVCSESTSSHKFSSPSENTLFDAVVIDEAAQALEPATLIPLQLLKSKGTKCIMVGDPKQLRATVLSNVASKYLFQCSMFERLQRANHPVIMLTHQYRMHPEICRFPSSHFYDGKLLNGDQMSGKAASFHKTRALGPYVFFDIIDGQDQHGKNSATLSLYNECEADAAVEVLKNFKKRYPSEFFGGRIGIITPYKSQLSLLRTRFSSAFGSAVTAEMEFNTVDGFQGREVDILLLSTVRAAGSEAPRINSSNLGFVADVRRMNVALTRAKLSLWILGNSRTLRTNQTWASLVEDAKARNLIISGTRPYSSMFKFASENRPASG